MIRFLQPEWFWALTVLPLVVLWRGRRGPVAAVEYSDVSLARDVARRTRSRIGGIGLAAADHRGGSHDRRVGPAAAHSQSHRSHGERNRHRAGTGRFGFDASARFQGRQHPRQPHRGGQVGRLQIHRRASQRPHRSHRVRGGPVYRESAHPGPRLAAAESRACQRRHRRRRNGDRLGHRRSRESSAHDGGKIQGSHTVDGRRQQQRENIRRSPRPKQPEPWA